MSSANSFSLEESKICRLVMDEGQIVEPNLPPHTTYAVMNKNCLLFVNLLHVNGQDLGYLRVQSIVKEDESCGPLIMG